MHICIIFYFLTIVPGDSFALTYGGTITTFEESGCNPVSSYPNFIQNWKSVTQTCLNLGGFCGTCLESGNCESAVGYDDIRTATIINGTGFCTVTG